MSKTKNPPTERATCGNVGPQGIVCERERGHPGDCAGSLVSAIPPDVDPYALLNAGASPATLQMPDVPKDPSLTTTAPPPSPADSVLPDMTDPRVRALYVNQGLDRPATREDADPLLVRCLELFERIHHGHLLYPYASEARELVRQVVPELRERVCRPATTEVGVTK